MVLVEQLTPVAKLLLEASMSRSTVPFREFHELFDVKASERDKYDTLEAASRALCSTNAAIYSAVLAKARTGSPGDGFFDIFKNKRAEEYCEIAGQSLTVELTPDQMREMASLERERVYEHTGLYFCFD